ncbi:MAG: VCBS repeat-containing protein [Cyclobacteriaceae bacterium]|nr:VCBS repeat-containing protein [Cyclobacteriaceae bacterium]
MSGQISIRCFVLMLLAVIGQSCKEPTPIISPETLFSLLSPAQTGIEFQNMVIEDEEHNHLTNDMFVAGAGVGIADINNDSLPDIFFAGNQVSDRLYLNQGNLQFQDITEQAGILSDERWSTGVTMVDINNDGFMDIYVCRSVQENPQLSENLLYINNGDLTFTEQAASFGISDRGFSVQATFFDADRDGFLDMYLVNQPPSLGKRTGEVPNRLNTKTVVYSDRFYWNKGNGKFQDVTLEAGLLNLAYGLSASIGDFNDDGWMDLYVANDFDRPDHLYINQANGTFDDQLNQGVKHISNFSMGSDVADYNNDGLLDLIVVDMVAEDHKRIKTNMGGMNPKDFWRIVNNGWHYQYMFNTLQRNNGNGTFSELAQLGGVSNSDWSWGPLWADFDNDGWKDLVVTNGIKRNQRYSDLEQIITDRLDSLEVVAENTGKELQEVINVMDFVELAPSDLIPNYAFKNNGDLTFSNMSEDWGLQTPTFSFGSAYADLDLDGDLDLVVNNMDDYAFVYRNNTSDQQPNNYLRFKLVDSVGSPVVGARVKLLREKQIWQLGELGNARGYMSKSEDWLHFGLGPNPQADSVAILWPDGQYQALTGVKANQSLVIIKGQQAEKIPEKKQSAPKLFAEVTNQLNLRYRHKENNYNDYTKEILLPHKMSNFGPGLATGDVTGDGLDDFYIGGAAGLPGSLFIQQRDGSFSRKQLEFWEEQKDFEDIAALFFDSDSDGDSDLYVVSGGNEFDKDAPQLQDRLYLNDGFGRFSKAKDKLPEMLTSGSCVVPYDYDLDGDLDLFVGGRLVPGHYPLPAASYLLRNEGGSFTDVTAKMAPELQNAGLVTAAVWTDYNSDGAIDIVLVGEWMPVTIFQNQGETFKNVTPSTALAQSNGWYYSIVSKDFDNDGDEDLVVGNLGLNYKYKASEEEPFEVYYNDFDDNGSYDIVLSYYEHGETYPVRGRSCSSQQVPMLSEKYPTFEEFGEASLTDIYGEYLDNAVHYQAQTFSSCYLENQGNGQFKIRSLPIEAQVSSINNILVADFDHDGHIDLLLSGNLYASEIETPRNDAGMGLFLKGDSKGNFKAVPLTESGFFAPHDAKDMKLITVGSQGTPVVLVANNQYFLQAIAIQSKAI